MPEASTHVLSACFFEQQQQYVSPWYVWWWEKLSWYSSGTAKFSSKNAGEHERTKTPQSYIQVQTISLLRLYSPLQQQKYTPAIVTDTSDTSVTTFTNSKLQTLLLLLLLHISRLYPLLFWPPTVVGCHDTLQVLGLLRDHADER